jgi:hypothetical protein
LLTVHLFFDLSNNYTEKFRENKLNTKRTIWAFLTLMQGFLE